MISSPFFIGSRPLRLGTPFFGDSAAIKALERLVRPPLRGSLSLKTPLRIWVPDCSTGEVTYSVAISVMEAMGSRWREIPLRVYSTDADPDRISHARAGRYAGAAVRGAPARMRRFFVQEAGGVRVHPFVRDACRFSVHDRARIPPFSQLDLVACPETLAELPAAEHKDAFRSFHGALAPGRLLFDPMRKAGDHSEFFDPLDAMGSYAARVNSPGIPDIGSRLRESEDRFEMLFSQSEEALLLKDAETDLILDANRAALRLFGWSLQEFLEMRGKDLIAPPAAVRRPSNERRSEQRLAMPHHRRKDGTFFPADVNTTSFIRRGRPAELWIVRDATERLRIDASRKREEEHNAFLGEVIHELRTPMTVIKGSAETLRRGNNSRWAQRKFLRSIENQADRLASMVDCLLDLNATRSVKRHTQPAPVALAKAVWSIVPNFVATAKRRGITLSIDIPENLTVLVDPEDFRHIIGNLLDNALKYNHRGGQVRVGARTEGGKGIVAVRDTGSGIPPDDLERIFERFYRTERTRQVKGNGLGLAIVQGMIKANGGQIAAENHPAGGAIFRVTLPLAVC